MVPGLGLLPMNTAFSTPGHITDLNKFGVLLFIFLSIAVVFRRRKTIFDYALSASLFICAFLIAENVNVDDRGRFIHPWLAGLSIPMTYFLMPLIYIFVNEIFLRKEKASEKKSYLPHFFAPVVLSVLSVPLFIDAGFDKLSHLTALRNGTFSTWGLPEFSYCLGLLLFYGYIIYFFRALLPALRFSLIKEESSLKVLVVVLIDFVLVLVGTTIAIARQDPVFFRYGCIFITLGGCTFMALVFRYPDFFEQLSVAVVQAHYKKSQLTNVDIKGVEQRLDELMLQKKLFTDPDLTLSHLAKQLSLNPNQLSQLLNSRLKKNFSQYVKELRVKEAEKLLLELKEDPVLSIGYRVGFNSSSSFNAGFKKLTGLSPKEYRQQKSTE